MDKPKISVIVLTYNAERFVAECLDSLLNQILNPFEIIVCDDASRDGTREIIRKYVEIHPGLFRPIFQPTNQGIARNINSGLGKVRGDYISLIAGDDGWYPDKLRLEIERLEAVPEARWVYSGTDFTDEFGNNLGSFERNFDGQEGDILFPMLCHQMSMHNWLAETSLFKQVGLYDSSFTIYEDWDYKIRLSAAAPIACVPAKGGWYRRHKQGASHSHWGVHIENLKGVYHKHQSLINSLPPEQYQQVIDRKRSDLTHFSRQMKKQILKLEEIPTIAQNYIPLVARLVSRYIQLQEQLEQQQRQLEQQQRQLEQQQRQLEQQQRQLEQQQRQLEQQQRQLEQLSTENKKLKIQLSVLLNSRSWKMTAPLRTIGELVRRLKK